MRSSTDPAPLACRTVARSARPRPSSRATATTVAPRRANSLAVAFPSAPVAPVTMQTPPTRLPAAPARCRGRAAALNLSFALYEAGHPIPMEVFVTEVHGLPQAGVPVLLRASVGTVTPDHVITDARGHAAFAFFAEVNEDTLVQVTAWTNLDGAAQGIDAFAVRVVRLPPPPIYAQAGIVSLGGLG